MSMWPGLPQQRALLTTHLSLLGSTVSTFLTSAVSSPGPRLSVGHLQNAVLAGGVIAGIRGVMAVM